VSAEQHTELNEEEGVAPELPLAEGEASAVAESAEETFRDSEDGLGVVVELADDEEEQEHLAVAKMRGVLNACGDKVEAGLRWFGDQLREAASPVVRSWNWFAALVGVRHILWVLGFVRGVVVFLSKKALGVLSFAPDHLFLKIVRSAIRAGVVGFLAYVGVGTWLGFDLFGVIGWALVSATAVAGFFTPARQSIFGFLLFWNFVSFVSDYFGGGVIVNVTLWAELVNLWEQGASFSWSKFLLLSGIIVVSPFGIWGFGFLAEMALATANRMRLWLQRKMFGMPGAGAIEVNEEMIREIKVVPFASFKEFKDGEMQRAAERKAEEDREQAEIDTDVESGSGAVSEIASSGSNDGVDEREEDFDDSMVGMGAADFLGSLETAGPKETVEDEMLAKGVNEHLAAEFAGVFDGPEDEEDFGDDEDDVLREAGAFIAAFYQEKKDLSGLATDEFKMVWRERYEELNGRVKSMVPVVNGGEEFVKTIVDEDGENRPAEEGDSAAVQTEVRNEEGPREKFSGGVIEGPSSDGVARPTNEFSAMQGHGRDEGDEGPDVWEVDDQPIEPEENEFRTYEGSAAMETGQESVQEGGQLDGGSVSEDDETNEPEAVEAEDEVSSADVEDEAGTVKQMDSGMLSLMLKGIYAEIIELKLDEDGVQTFCEISEQLGDYLGIYKGILDGSAGVELSEAVLERLSEFGQAAIFVDRVEEINAAIEQSDEDKLEALLDELGTSFSYRPAMRLMEGVGRKLESIRFELERGKVAARKPEAEGSVQVYEDQLREKSVDFDKVSDSLRKGVLAENITKDMVRVIRLAKDRLDEFRFARVRMNGDAAEKKISVEHHEHAQYLDDLKLVAFNICMSIEVEKNEDLSEYLELSLGAVTFRVYQEVLGMGEEVALIKKRYERMHSPDLSEIDRLKAEKKELQERVEAISGDLKQKEFEAKHIAEQLVELKETVASGSDAAGLSDGSFVDGLNEAWVQIQEQLTSRFGDSVAFDVVARRGRSSQFTFDAVLEDGDCLVCYSLVKTRDAKISFVGEKDGLFSGDEEVASAVTGVILKCAEAKAMADGFDKVAVRFIACCDDDYARIASRSLKAVATNVFVKSSAEVFAELEIEKGEAA